MNEYEIDKKIRWSMADVFVALFWPIVRWLYSINSAIDFWYVVLDFTFEEYRLHSSRLSCFDETAIILSYHSLVTLEEMSVMNETSI